MHRRHFLLATLYGFLVFIAASIFKTKYGAVFQVVRVLYEGSGQDWSGHQGAYVYNATRCCSNCCIIFAAWAPGGDVDNGPSFVPHELRPVNAAARRILAVAMTKAPDETYYALAA